MDTGETRKVWWTYDHAPTRRAIVISMVVAWLLAVLLLYSDVVKILATRPWWVDFIVAVATVAVPFLAFFELRHSAEANRLRGEANEERREANNFRAEANQLREKNAQLAAALDAERNQHLAQIAANTARPSQEPAASLKIHPAADSRYILKPIGQQGAHGNNFKGGHLQFWLRVENSGNRNSAVDRYKIWIQELGREFGEIVPVQVGGLLPGRHCQHGIGWPDQRYLNAANLIKIPPDNSTDVGCLWFSLPELTTEMFANAGLQMQGPERRFSSLHCRLTVTDSNGVSASGDFELSEA
jgi:hypothetical protein